ncbi:hypothetical protein [Halalkalibacter urbisdiaboli]|uniref:hypothetical protein n=1 Tax=Halalkalibacter urbisdiaboli TaxID=1960589 RepID=UPI000B43EFCD|nr:hypothetical protein [Halalkalibacter urbisdiaboli]
MTMLIVSTIEWFSLLMFPLILVGYRFKHYVKRLILLAVIMSVISLLLHHLIVHLTIIVGMQIMILFVLAGLILKLSLMETLLISGIGYGFYCFVHILIIELYLLLLTHSYSELFVTSHIYYLQLASALVVIVFCLLIHLLKYKLIELYQRLQLNSFSMKSKSIIVVNSILTYIFICLASYAMISENINYRYAYVLTSIIVLFCIIAFYLILHSQFQTKRLIETTKLFLDQEQQMSIYIENIQKELQGPYKALQKLFDSGSLESSKAYFQQHILPKGLDKKGQTLVVGQDIKDKDEILYAFLINKQKLAHLLGVSLSTSFELPTHVLISLNQLKVLGNILDDLFLSLYLASHYQEKNVHFHVRSTKDRIEYEITSNFVYKNAFSSSKIHDAILDFKKSKATIHSSFEPICLMISCEKSL